MRPVAVVADGTTGQLLTRAARARGHEVRTLAALDDQARAADTVTGAAAIVLIPRRGDAVRHADTATRALVQAAHRYAPGAHLLLVSSFAVGHGPAHPFNRATGTYPGRLAAERALRASGLPWTIIRPTWLTDDPPGAHAVTLTQDLRADGMLARADLADVLVAAIEHPAARGKTFALFNEPGTPVRDWAARFAALRRDRGAA